MRDENTSAEVERTFNVILAYISDAKAASRKMIVIILAFVGAHGLGAIYALQRKSVGNLAPAFYAAGLAMFPVCLLIEICQYRKASHRQNLMFRARENASLNPHAYIRDQAIRDAEQDVYELGSRDKISFLITAYFVALILAGGVSSALCLINF